jgi:hypothetical protein
MKILAIDPGERVGWATGTITPDGEGHALTVTGQGVDTLRDFSLSLEQHVREADVVIYETWRLYPHMAKKMIGNDMQPSQLIGIIRFVCWKDPSVKVVTQGASIKNTALKTMPEELHERMELSTEQHDQDAIMHLWHYYWKNYAQPEE